MLRRTCGIGDPRFVCRASGTRVFGVADPGLASGATLFRPLGARACLPFGTQVPYDYGMKSSVVSVSADVMGGTPVFAGTRVPVQTFVEHIACGETIDDFLEGFPSVQREQLITFLKEAERYIVSAAR